MAKKLTEVTPADSATVVDEVTLMQDGAVKRIAADKLPLSTPQAQALAPYATQTQLAAGLQSVKDQLAPGGAFPAGSVRLDSGEMLQARLDRLDLQLTALGSIAPVNTAQPGAPTGTIGPTNTLTAQTGDWTGASSYRYLWYRFDPNSGQFLSTGITTSTYPQTSADVGYKLAVAVAGVASNGTPSTYVMSLLTATVTATVPTNSVKPTIAPTGSQPVGTTYSFATPGTWANDSGATIQYKWTLGVGGVDSDIAGATAATYTSISGQEGGVIKGWMRKTTAQGASTWVESSNSSTVSGSPALTNTAAPAFASTVRVGVAGTITAGAWSGGTPDANRYYDIYVAEGSGGLVTPYATIGPVAAGAAQYTPEQDGNSWLQQQTGLTSLVGKNVTVKERVTFGGSTYVSSPSASKTVQAPVSTLVATAQVSTLSITQGVAMTATVPVLASGGTAPYTYSHNAASGTITGLTFNAATGAFSGTPSNTFDVSVTVTVTDAAGATASAAFRFQSTAAVVVLPEIGTLRADVLFSQHDGYVQLLGGSRALSAVSETDGVSGSTLITGPSTLGSSLLRFGKINDPITPSRKVFYCAGKSGDPATFGHAGRVEMGPNQTVSAMVKSGVTYWLAAELLLPASRFAGGVGAGNVLQVHIDDPAGTRWGPLALLFAPAGYAAPNAGLAVVYTYSTTSTSGDDVYAWISDNPGFGSIGGAAYPKDVFAKWVIKYRGSLGGNAGILQCWLNGTQVVNLTNINIGVNSPGYPNDYAKIGFDDYQLGGGVSGTYELIRSFHVLQDNGYSVAQVQALLT